MEKKSICKCGCGEQFDTCDSRGRVRKFKHGHNKGHLGMIHSDDTRKKMGATNLGRKLTIEHRAKISLNGVHKDKNINWNGGVTKTNDKIRKSFEYKLWREAVFKRDNYTCVWCGEKESVSGKLNADHIKPFAYYPELRFAIDNGRTLCIDCHRKTDTYLWRGMYNYTPN